MKNLLFLISILIITSCGSIDLPPKGDQFDDNGNLIFTYTLKSKRELMLYKISNKRKIILTKP